MVNETVAPVHPTGDKLGRKPSGQVMDDVVSTFNEINNMKTITQRLKQSNIRNMAKIKRSYSKTQIEVYRPVGNLRKFNQPNDE